MASNDVCTPPSKRRVISITTKVYLLDWDVYFIPPYNQMYTDFSHVPLFTEWLTVPKLLGPLQPLTGQCTACWVKVTSPKTAWAKLLRWGLTDSCSQGWTSHASYLDSSLQMKVRPAETRQLLSVDPVLYGFEFKEKATYYKGLSAHEGHKQIQRACVVPTEWSRSWLGEGGWTTSLSISVCLALQRPWLTVS